MNFIKIFWLLFYILIFFLLLHNSFSYLDPDLGWHLKAGENIIETGSLPHINNYNYTLQGKHWVDHEWLIDVFSFWIYDNFGYIALSVFFALLTVLTLAIWHLFIQKNYLKNKRGLIFVMVFLLWGVFAISPHFGVRMQEITFLNLALLLIILFYYNNFFR